MKIIYDNLNSSNKTKLNKQATNSKIEVFYTWIYDNLENWRDETADQTQQKNLQKWSFEKINLVFLRILYTLKMMGDHGQVKFIKELKKIPNFNTNFEVLFTTGDSLARLYACCNEITNMSVVTNDFPSKEYCVSKPKGMVYYV